MRYTVTGGTGHLGSQIVEKLSKVVPITDIRVGVHTVKKATDLIKNGFDVQGFDFFDETSLQRLLSDTDVFIYIPSKSSTSFERIKELEKVITAAEATKVGHFLAMGFIADQVNNPFSMSAFYGCLPRRLAETGLKYTVIRNALYADPLVPYLPELIQRGHVVYPMSDQALSFISLQDSAKAFAKVATEPKLLVSQKIYTLTQSRNYTMDQLGQVLTQVSGHEIGYQPMTSDEFAQTYNEDGGGLMLASMYQAGAMGLLDELSDDYQHITGQKATELSQFLTEEYSQ